MHVVYYVSGRHGVSINKCTRLLRLISMRWIQILPDLYWRETTSTEVENLWFDKSFDFKLMIIILLRMGASAISRATFFFSYLFSFYPSCISHLILRRCARVLSGHSSRHCFPLFGAVSWNWERLLGGGWLGGGGAMAHSSSTYSVFSPTEMFLLLFSSRPSVLDQRSLGESVKSYSSLMIPFPNCGLIIQRDEISTSSMTITLSIYIHQPLPPFKVRSPTFLSCSYFQDYYLAKKKKIGFLAYETVGLQTTAWREAEIS